MPKIFVLALSLASSVFVSCASKQAGDRVIVDRKNLQGKTPAQVVSLYDRYVFAGWFREKTDYILVYPKASFETERSQTIDTAACLEVHFEREDRFMHAGWMTERACDEYKDKKIDDALLKKKNPIQQASSPN